MTEETMTAAESEAEPEEVLYEEWIAHADQHKYVPERQHFHFANNGGWWSTGTLVALETVQALGREPEHVQPRKAKA